jgi:ketosteroid isomerase-like protein
VNQNTITSHPEIASYFKEWFGEGGYLQSLHMTLKPDALTELYNDNTMGIVRGNGVEKYKLTDGRDLDLKTRWTATLIKDVDGKWRILALHLGTNFYDNAIFHESKRFLTKMGVVGSLIGLVIGIIIGFLLRRRKLNQDFS